MPPSTGSAELPLPVRCLPRLSQAASPHETGSMPANDTRSVVLEIVAMRLCLRVGHEIVTTTEIDANALLRLRAAAHSYAVRRGIAFVDITRN